MLERIVAPDLVEHVTERLREAILTGTLPPGEHLVEEQLASQLEVSRAPVREALRLLEYDGLVTGLGRRGRFVSELSARDAWEVYTLRETLEAMAVEQVAPNRPDDMIQSLSAIVDEMRAASANNDRKHLSELDVQFHRKICETAHHERLMRAWDSMSNQIRLLSQQVVGTQYRNLEEVPQRHQILIDTIVAGKSGPAMAAIRAHIDSVASVVIGHLEERSQLAGASHPKKAVRTR